MCSNSARKVKAQRSPHQAAGTVLKARLMISGRYHFRSTPRMTATRGCKTEEGAWPASWLLLGAWDVEEAGEGGTALEEGTDEGATALSRKPAAEIGAEGKGKNGGEERGGGGGVVEGVVR